MPLAERRARVVWEGNLIKGVGTVDSGSGAFGPLPVTWASRTERPDGKTSPEELISAAQAACYAMAFSHTLDQQGRPPKKLDITAVTSLEKTENGIKVAAIDIEVRGQVDGMDQETFARIADEAEKGCPVANALRNNVEIRVKAVLETS